MLSMITTTSIAFTQPSSNQPSMKIPRNVTAILALLVLFALPVCLTAAEKTLTEAEKIEALIKHLGGLKDATFIRNGSDYDAKTAATFLHRKWQAQEKNIKTAADFIDKVASISSTSGKPYVIRFKGAREVKSGDYLKEQLKKLDAEKAEKPQ